MALHEQLAEYVRACFTAIWVETSEPHEALAAVDRLCREEGWRLATWDVESGLRSAGAEPDPAGGDPLAAVRSPTTLSGPGETSLLVLGNFHRFLGSAEVVQALARRVLEGRRTRSVVVVLAPAVRIPAELEKLFVVVGHELPGRGQLAEIAREVATGEGELPSDDAFEAVLDAAAGLTRLEAENAFSLSLVRHGRVAPDAVWELKSGQLGKSGPLELHRGGGGFAGLGGLGALKTFCRRALARPSRGDALGRARGVLLLSPPGCGKSEFCKALGGEVGRPVLRLDVGSLLGSLVGQSEERTRQALAVVDAMAPCVVMIDEVEKAFAGASGSGDSGVTSRMFGTFLSWLNDHDSDVFVVCTANDVSRLPPEFARSERFDGVFFLDLPTREEKDGIWAIYRGLFGIGEGDRRPDDEGWTGAEIRACCRLAALLDAPLGEAARNVVPVAVTAAESVERLRAWASGRCLSAREPGIYRHAAPKSGTRRGVNRDPSAN